MAKKKPAATTPAPSASNIARWLAPITSRPKWLAALAMVVVAAFIGDRAWRSAHSYLARLPQYQLSAESVSITPPPAWIRCDIKTEVLRDAGLVGELSVLGDTAQVTSRIVDAFAIHPWVRQVESVELVAPAGAKVALVYRQPVAAIEIRREGMVELLPVDAQCVRLPDGDLNATEKQYLPRIVQIEGQVLVGEAWADPRVVGGVQLALALTPHWNDLHLVDILPSDYPQVRKSQRFFEYDLRASYGTLIRWGAAPALGPNDEDTFEVKLARLQSYITEQGPLNSIATPKAIDVRQGLAIEQRTAKKPDEAEASSTR